jgi:hypothetical protein
MEKPMKITSKKKSPKQSLAKVSRTKAKLEATAKQPIISQSALKQAYQLVQADLLTTFQKMKAGQCVRLNNIGTFEKNQSKMTSHLPKARGQTYLY